MNRSTTPFLTQLAAALCLSGIVGFADDAGDFAENTVSLDKFEVTGTRPQAVDTTTLKMPAKVLDTPRSLMVIDSSRIREQDFQTGADLLLWVPGINTNGAVQESYHYYARGYRMGPNDWRVDGFQGRVIGGSYSPNLFGVENVAVLKGPAGLLYGAAASPGGMLNLTTKKPQELAATSVDTRIRTMDGGELGFGSRISTEIEFDSTGPVTRNGRLLYRALASVEHTEHPADGQVDDSTFYRLAFTYRLDQAGRYQVSPFVEWSREDRAQRNAVISPSSSLATNDGRTDYTFADVSSRAVNLSAGGRVDDNFTAGADLAAQFTPAWRANASFRLHERDFNNSAWAIQTATLARANTADPRSYTVQRRHTRSRSETENASLDVNSDYEFAGFENFRSHLLVGVNGRVTDSQAYTAANGANQSPINIYTGAFTTPLVADASPVLPLGNRTETTAWNAYAQSQNELFSDWVLTLGFAYAREQTTTTTPAGLTTKAPARHSDLTPNASLVYRLSRAVSLYTSYSTSYALVDPLAEDERGAVGTFAPTQGENYEAGAKAEFFGSVLAASLSVFNTELNGVLTQSQVGELNPNGNRFYRQTDTGRRAQGVETEFTLNVTRGWQTTFTYAYVDAFNRNANGSRGAAAEMTPRHAASVYSRYVFMSGPAAGLSLRLGYIWQDSRWGGSAAPSVAAPDPLRLGAFSRIDAGVGYNWRNWRFALNVENLTNEYYLLAGNTGLAMSPVNPRSLALRAGFTW